MGAFLIPAIFALVTLVMWTIGGVWLFRVRSDVSRGTRVMGEVTGFGSYVSRGQTMYYAHYRVVLGDGRSVTGRSAMAKNWQSPSVGTKVPLVYRGDRPEQPLGEMGFAQYLLTIIMFGVGLPFAVLTVATEIDISRKLDAPPRSSTSTTTASPSAAATSPGTGRRGPRGS